jgi:hypothetical protein
MSDKSGSAFPVDCAIEMDHTNIQGGLTKREWFAGMMLVSGKIPNDKAQPVSTQAVARICFEMADAMIEEAKK